MPKLRIRNGPYNGREKTLESTALTIGRDAEAGIQILDRSASRFHAEVFPVGGMFFVRDLESKNGTYVNDERLVDEELLRESDVIKIGTTELQYESGAAIHDGDSSDRVSYADDADMLSNTLEFRIDDLTDLEDEADSKARGEGESRSLQILYQVGRLVGQNEGDGVIAQVLDTLLQAMPCEAALVFLRERGSGKLVPHTVRNAVHYAPPVISRTIIRRTVAENRAFFTADAQIDERLNRKESVIAKGVRSVVCVPLTMAGQTRGVVYLSRSISADPFTKTDMELLSACSMQLGLAFLASERQRAHRRSLWTTLSALVQALEQRAGGGSRIGSGDAAARAASAVATALHLGDAALWRIQLAALLSQVPELCVQPVDCIDACIGLLRSVEEMNGVLDLIVAGRERLDGSGPQQQGESEIGTEERVLAVATSFSQSLRSNPDGDADQHISRLESHPGYDDEVVAALRNCHLNGSLYQAVTV